MSRLSLAALALPLIASAATPAFAAGKTSTQCITSYDRAITTSKAGKLREARTLLAECTLQACPPDVRTECEKLLAGVREAVPSLIFEVKDRAGRDVADAVVKEDGALIAGALDGKPIEFDPGRHTFAISAPDKDAVNATFVLREGEKGRHERIVIGPPVVEPPAPAVAPPAPAKGAVVTDVSSADPVQHGSGVKIAGATLAGVGVVGLAVGAVFGVLAISDSNAQKAACNTGNCGTIPYNQAISDHQNATTASIVSPIAFAGGGALLIAGAVMWLTAPKGGTKKEPSVSLSPTFGPGAGGVLLRGTF